VYHNDPDWHCSSCIPDNEPLALPEPAGDSMVVEDVSTDRFRDEQRAIEQAIDRPPVMTGHDHSSSSTSSSTSSSAPSSSESDSDSASAQRQLEWQALTATRREQGRILADQGGTQSRARTQLRYQKGTHTFKTGEMCMLHLDADLRGMLGARALHAIVFDAKQQFGNTGMFTYELLVEFNGGHCFLKGRRTAMDIQYSGLHIQSLKTLMEEILNGTKEKTSIPVYGFDELHKLIGVPLVYCRCKGKVQDPKNPKRMLIVCGVKNGCKCKHPNDGRCGSQCHHSMPCTNKVDDA
jgi:hypothetical protein